MLVCVPVESCIDLGLTMRTLNPHKKQLVQTILGQRPKDSVGMELWSHSDKQERAHGEFINSKLVFFAGWRKNKQGY